MYKAAQDAMHHMVDHMNEISAYFAVSAGKVCPERNPASGVPVLAGLKPAEKVEKYGVFYAR